MLRRGPIRRIAVAGALASALLGVGAAMAAGNGSATSLDAPAQASEQAVRITTTTTTTPMMMAPSWPTRGPGTLQFPMNPSPSCLMLNNYGDGRGGTRKHEGTDIMATLGQEVYAVEDGVLYRQFVDGQSNATLSGNGWDLRGTSKTTYAFLHLAGFAPGLSVGDAVVKGQLIGYVGDTGNPGPGNYHLHFEVHPGGGSAVDPYPLLDIPTACRG